MSSIHEKKGYINEVNEEVRLLTSNQYTLAIEFLMRGGYGTYDMDIIRTKENMYRNFLGTNTPNFVLSTKL